MFVFPSVKRKIYLPFVRSSRFYLNNRREKAGNTIYARNVARNAATTKVHSNASTTFPPTRKYLADGRTTNGPCELSRFYHNDIESAIDYLPSL